jgi:DNA repair exonuclease SbcCD nuclease subunit
MEAGHINILLVHGTVDMSFKQDIYNPMTSENLANLGMDYIALGHFHNRIDNVGGKGNIYNPGSPEPLGFDEKGEHGVYIGSIVKEKGEEIFLNVIFSALNRRYYEKLEINADGCNNDEQIIFRIEEALRDRDAIRGLFYIVLKGYMERGFKVNPTYIVSHFKDLVFFMKLKDETAMDYDYESIINEPGIKGLFAKKILAMLNKTEDEYEKKQLLKSLHYGIEALEHGKIEIN